MRKPNFAPPVISPEEARRSFEKVEPRINALPPEQLVPINVDMARAAGIVLIAGPRIRALSEDMKRHTPSFGTRNIDALRDVALAAWYVHTTISPPAMEDVPRRVLNEAIRLRRSLLTQARALAERGLLPGERVPTIEGRRNSDLGGVLLRLAELFQSSWDVICSKTPVAKDEIERAFSPGTELKTAYRRPDVDVGVLRVRTFSLLARTYDQVRRVVAYIRWNERDSDDFAPSIYTGSRGGRRSGHE